MHLPSKASLIKRKLCRFIVWSQRANDRLLVTSITVMCARGRFWFESPAPKSWNISIRYFCALSMRLSPFLINLHVAYLESIREQGLHALNLLRLIRKLFGLEPQSGKTLYIHKEWVNYVTIRPHSAASIFCLRVIFVHNPPVHWNTLLDGIGWVTLSISTLLDIQTICVVNEAELNLM